jgi:hypothetical protein
VKALTGRTTWYLGPGLQILFSSLISNLTLMTSILKHDSALEACHPVKDSILQLIYVTIRVETASV